MSAMVIGAISPDFEYFLRMNLEGRFSHTAMGAFLLDIPMGAALFFLFHILVKKPIIDNLPTYFAGRAQQLREFDAVAYWNAYYIPFLGCLAIGTWSHILLDSLTHERDFIVQKFELFRRTVQVTGLPEYPAYNYVYYVGTLIGALVIGIVFHFMKREDVTPRRGAWKFWAVNMVVTIAIFYLMTSGEFEYFGSIVVAVIGAFLWSVIITSIGYRFVVNGQKENMGTSRQEEG